MKKVFLLLKILSLSILNYAQIPTNGLVAYYPFNGNANDESGNNHHGVIEGDVYFSRDRMNVDNSSAYFTAHNCYSQIKAYIDPNDIDGGLTISIWVKKDSISCSEFRFLASYFSNVGILNTTRGHFQFYEQLSGFSLNHYVMPGMVLLSDFGSLNNWVHICYTNDGVTAKLYRNGNLVESMPNPVEGVVKLGDMLFFGHLGNFWNNDAFKGWLDDIGIWNRALSVNEIQQLVGAKVCNGNTFIGGGSDNNFSNPDNWCMGTVPTANQHIIIASGKSMDVDMDYTCGPLTISNDVTFHCTGGHVLTITEGVFDGNGRKAIDIKSSLQVRSSIKIPELISGTFTDSRDGHLYNWVKIGTQVWMAENLAYLPAVIGSGTGSQTDPNYYVYGYEGTVVADAKATANYSTYGVIYNWPAAMAGAPSSSSSPSGVQGVCPSGWHLPSDAEWTTLTSFLGGEGEGVAGGMMKETGLAHWSSPNTGATNSSGFSGLPGGYRYYWAYFDIIGFSGYWWSSTENTISYAWYRYLEYNSAGVYSNYGYKGHGISVRCMKN
jgi:uncharacterized protein (TIGR02145 family)